MTETSSYDERLVRDFTEYIRRAVNLGEAIEADDMGLPSECVDEGVTWLDLGD